MKPSTIASALLTAQERLPALEAEILLAFTLHQTRTWLYTYPEHPLTPAETQTFQELITRREQGEPIAYLTHTQEFWSLPLTVSPAVLIPRPETEELVECILESYPQNTCLNVVDLGTGSGAIALALAHERPHWQILATDVSAEALAVAKHNAQKLGLNSIEFQQATWLDFPTPTLFDLIISNPPYIAEDDPHLTQGDLRYEPLQALTGGKTGLEQIEIIISQSVAKLAPSGSLWLEQGYDQTQDIQRIAKKYGKSSKTYTDLAGQPRMTRIFSRGAFTKKLTRG